MKRTIKYSSNKFFKKKYRSVITDAVIRTHRILRDTTTFLKIHVLILLKKNKALPLINQNFILACARTVSRVTNKGRKLLSTSELEKVYNDHFFKYKPGNYLETNRDKIGQILSSASKEIETALNNDIQMNFKSRQKRYIETRFIELEIEKKISSYDLKSLIYQILNLVNMPEKQNSHPIYLKYTGFIHTMTLETVPSNIEKSIYYSLEKDPQMFLPTMFQMLKYFEKQGKKLFSLIPQKKTFIPSYIHLDTKALVDLLCDKEKSKKMTNLALIGAPVRQLKKKLKQIQTNLKSEKNSKKISTFKKQTISLCQDLVNAQKNCEKNYRKAQNTIWAEFLHLDKIPGFDPQTFCFYLSTDGYGLSFLFEKPDSIKSTDLHNLPSKGIIDLEDLSTAQKNQIKRTKVVSNDPGRQGILHILGETNEDEIAKLKDKKLKVTRDKKGTVYRYGLAQRRFECRFKQSKQWRDKLKTSEISKLESQIGSSKSVDLRKYKPYLKRRFEMEEKMYEYYERGCFRKSKMLIYQATQRSEANIINDIKSKFETNHQQLVIAYGRWNGSNWLKGLNSTPNVRFRKLLSNHFLVVVTDEHGTTKTCPCGGPVSEERSRIHPNYKKKINKKTGEPVMKDVRGLRRCTTCHVLWHRDYHASLNIRNNFDHYLEHEKYNPKFRKQHTTGDL